MQKTRHLLPARPNLEHLKGQAKQLKKDAGLKLADAQAQVARKNGFASWAALGRHVEALRALEGAWQFASLVVDGLAVLAPTSARILIDGDRFRTESPEVEWEGIFTIDAESVPRKIDLAFVSGPDAGETCHGIYQHEGDTLTICLGVVGATRPTGFVSEKGTGHALETLQRASKARPANVQGGTPPPPTVELPIETGNPADFELRSTPLLERLQGEWGAIALVTDGKPMPDAYLPHVTRTMNGNELRVTAGGQTMIHAKVRIDERATPIAIDYLDLRKGGLTRGIMEWVGEEVRFLMGKAGAARPASFDDAGTLSRWRRR